MIKFEKVVYLSHPYGGKKKNLKAISEILREVQAEHPTFLFLSPVNMFSCLYSDMPYKEGLDRCLWLLDGQTKCGCLENIKAAKDVCGNRILRRQ